MTRVSVPKKTGEITIRTGKAGVEEVLQFEEKGGYVEVPEKHLDVFLTNVGGAAVAPEAPATSEAAAGSESPAAPEAPARKRRSG